MTHLDLGGRSFELARGTVVGPVDGGAVVAGSDVAVVHDLGTTRFFRHGWHSWSLTHWADLSRDPERLLVPAGEAQSEDPVATGMPGHAGNGVGAIEGPGGTALVLGALGVDAVVTGTPDDLAGTGETELEWFVGYGPAEETLAAYARALGERLGNARRDLGHVWCSWYSYYQEVTESEMRDVLKGIDGLGFDVFQLDDGWQDTIGDWNVGGDFPSGLDTLASEIAAAGYRPGLWIAPFIAHETSRIARERPDLFVHGPDGAPAVAGTNWGGVYYGLDMTHPEAQEHVRSVIRRAVDWGYTYLKLDFLFAAALPGERSVAIGREAAYRRGIELIREAAGDDVYLLACGSPIIPSVGVFNGMRVGPDVAPYWENDLVAPYVRDFTKPSTRYAVSTSLNRLWLRDVIAVDPDVVYVRTRFNLMSRAHRQALQDLALVCGFVACSDPPQWLGDRERDELRAYLAATPPVERLDRYRFRIGDRVVDFAHATLDHRLDAGAQADPVIGATFTLPSPREA